MGQSVRVWTGRIPARALLGVLIAAVVLPSSACTSAPQRACAEPEVTMTPDVVASGESITVVGENFDDACRDAGEGAGIGVDVRIDMTDTEGLQWGDRVLTGSDGSFTVELLIPDDAVPGTVKTVVEWEWTGLSATETRTMERDFIIAD